MAPKIAPNRNIERLGVNAAQQLFERCNCIFQEVAQQNDYGKDAYVDLAQGHYLSPLCVAVQIKSGRSYRLPSGDYFVPVENHASIWRNSTVPVFGIVYDPDDSQLRWGDLTAYLRNHPVQDGGRVPVQRHALLTEASIANEFKHAVSTYAAAGGGSIAIKLLSGDTDLQNDAVLDAWALGRGDARFLLLLRRLIVHLSVEPTRRAIWALSHATPHPDIFWTPDNWIPDSVRWQVQRSFRWSAEEIAHLFLAIYEDECGRGTLTQSLHMLLTQDLFFGENFDAAIRDLLDSSETRRAFLIVLICLAAAEDPRQALEDAIIRHPALSDDEWLQELRIVLSECNEFSLY